MIPRIRENKVETHLRRRVKETGGEHRKCTWQGRRGAPDEFVMWRPLALHAWVECKRPGEVASAQQLREHERMRAAGCVVVVLTTIAEVDAWVEKMTNPVMEELR